VVKNREVIHVRKCTAKPRPANSTRVRSRLERLRNDCHCTRANGQRTRPANTNRQNPLANGGAGVKRTRMEPKEIPPMARRTKNIMRFGISLPVARRSGCLSRKGKQSYGAKVKPSIRKPSVLSSKPKIIFPSSRAGKGEFVKSESGKVLRSPARALASR